MELKYQIEQDVSQLQFQEKKYEGELGKNNYFLERDWDIFVIANLKVIFFFQGQLSKTFSDITLIKIFPFIEKYNYVIGFKNSINVKISL